MRQYGERNHRSRWSDATVEWARDLHEHDGWGAARIAAKIGAPLDTVNDWIYYRTRIGPQCYQTLRRRAAKEREAA